MEARQESRSESEVNKGALAASHRAVLNRLIAGISIVEIIYKSSGQSTHGLLIGKPSDYDEVHILSADGRPSRYGFDEIGSITEANPLRMAGCLNQARIDCTTLPIKVVDPSSPGLLSVKEPRESDRAMRESILKYDRALVAKFVPPVSEPQLRTLSPGTVVRFAVPSPAGLCGGHAVFRAVTKEGVSLDVQTGAFPLPEELIKIQAPLHEFDHIGVVHPMVVASTIQYWCNGVGIFGKR